MELIDSTGRNKPKGKLLTEEWQRRGTELLAADNDDDEQEQEEASDDANRSRAVLRTHTTSPPPSSSSLSSAAKRTSSSSSSYLSPLHALNRKLMEESPLVTRSLSAALAKAAVVPRMQLPPSSDS